MKTIRWYSGVALGLSLCGCGAAGDLDSIEVEDAVGSVKEAALLKPRFKRVSKTIISPAAGTGRVTVKCPSDHPYLLGTGAEADDGTLRQITPSEGSPTEVEVNAAVEDQEEKITAEAVCSDATALRFASNSSTGQMTRACPKDSVAVGGGAKCYGDARLFRSRPDPDSDGSEPTGWAAACTSGAVETFAICIPENQTYDFTTVRTARKDGTGSVEVACPAQSTALSAGGYCGNNKPLRSLDLNTDLSGATARCDDSSANVHAYVVCRKWQLTPPVR